MKSYIKELVKGINKDKIEKEDENNIKKLLKIGILKEKEAIYKLNKKYKIGIVDISKSGIGFLSLIGEEGRDILIEAEKLATASNGDVAIVKKIERSGRTKGEIVFILERASENRIVVTKKVGNKIKGFDIKTKQFIDIAETQKSLKKLPPETILKIDSYQNRVLEVIGVLSDPKVDEKLSLALFNKREEFSKEAIREAESFGDEVDASLYPDRVDLRDLNFCTIDPVTAKDFDDAIYYDVEKRELFVAIADVSEYVFELGAIDREAKERGFSIYFPHKAIPMLPKNLSENICSLKPNVDRLAFCFKITLDKSCEVVKEELFEAIINSKRRFNYDEVDILLKNPEKAKDEIEREILKSLIPLSKVTKELYQKRIKNGFDLESDEVRMELDEKTNLISTKIEKETPSHKLIEDCMLLANRASAKILDNGIYRIHDRPKEDKIFNLLSTLSEIGIYGKVNHTNIYKLFVEIQQQADRLNIRNYCDRLLIQSQQSACYSSENIGHFGLGFKEYSHFTSPIRRYSDLLLHRLLKAKIRDDNKRLKYLSKDIQQKCDEISKLEREAMRVEWDYLDRKFARWAKEHIGETFKAIVVDNKRTPIAILKDEKVEGARLFVLTYRELDLFENIEVEISDSDIITREIIVKLV